MRTQMTDHRGHPVTETENRPSSGHDRHPVWKQNHESGHRNRVEYDTATVAGHIPHHRGKEPGQEKQVEQHAEQGHAQNPPIGEVPEQDDQKSRQHVDTLPSPFHRQVALVPPRLQIGTGLVESKDASLTLTSVRSQDAIVPKPDSVSHPWGGKNGLGSTLEPVLP